MKKKEYMQHKSEVIAINGDTMMDGGQWWSVQVNPDEEIEDDDIGAKQGFFSDDDESWGSPSAAVVGQGLPEQDGRPSGRRYHSLTKPPGGGNYTAIVNG